MNFKEKQKLKLMTTMNEAIEYIKQNEKVEECVYDNFKEALLSLGVNKENRMIELIESMKSDRSNLEEFINIFEKWFDVNIITLSNRIKTSESYKNGFLGCDRKFKSLIAGKRLTNPSFQRFLYWIIYEAKGKPFAKAL